MSVIVNSEAEKNILKQSLRATGNLNDTVHCLERVLKNHTPFAMYIATADKTDCAWIFDPEMIYDMVGGDEYYEKAVEAIYGQQGENEEEKQLEVLFFIFKKVGPLHVLRISLDTIDCIVEELYEEL